MLSGNDFNAGYKVEEDGKLSMQLVFKPIIGQLTPSPDQTEDMCVAEMAKQMGNALNNMVFGQVRSALYALCAEAVGSPVESKIRTLLDNLNIDLSDMVIKKVGDNDGKEGDEA